MTGSLGLEFPFNLSSQWLLKPSVFLKDLNNYFFYGDAHWCGARLAVKIWVSKRRQELE